MAGELQTPSGARAARLAECPDRTTALQLSIARAQTFRLKIVWRFLRIPHKPFEEPLSPNKGSVAGTDLLNSMFAATRKTQMFTATDVLGR